MQLAFGTADGLAMLCLHDYLMVRCLLCNAHKGLVSLSDHSTSTLQCPASSSQKRTVQVSCIITVLRDLSGREQQAACQCRCPRAMNTQCTLTLKHGLLCTRNEVEGDRSAEQEWVHGLHDRRGVLAETEERHGCCLVEVFCEGSVPFRNASFDGRYSNGQRLSRWEQIGERPGGRSTEQQASARCMYTHAHAVLDTHNWLPVIC